MPKVTCALIINDGKVLITQNGAASDHPFQWEFPGGKIKPDEREHACVIREIKEELELDILVVDKLVAVEHDYGIKKIKLIPFVCTIVGGNLKLNNHINKKWLSVCDLAEVDFSEADKRLISLAENLALLEKYSGK